MGTLLPPWFIHSRVITAIIDPPPVSVYLSLSRSLSQRHRCLNVTQIFILFFTLVSVLLEGSSADVLTGMCPNPILHPPQIIHELFPIFTDMLSESFSLSTI